MPELTAAQRKHLRRIAHPLEPLIIVGKQGVTPALLTATDAALADHELIKVRFNEFKDEKKALIAEIAEKTDAAVAGAIGHVAILYRAHPDPEKRRIVLPA